jgi:DEAD/DEAH box helicase domain-containing protein
VSTQEWVEVYSANIPSQPGSFVPVSDLPVTAKLRSVLGAEFLSGIYGHQADAISRVIRGENVCLATGTASGKTLAFATAAAQMLLTQPGSRVLAIYPQKSLANEQERRWNALLSDLGIPGAVGRIDGSVSVSSRNDILRRSRVIVMTPDVMHAWMFSNLSNPEVKSFLRNLALVVVDEVHTYTGVLGSNSAYLFRRLQHACSLLGRSFQFFAASATIRDPIKHLKLLFGLDFSLIGPEADASPKQEVKIKLLSPPKGEDFLTALTRLLQDIRDSDKRFIAFVDSRKQTEQIASILSRSAVQEEDENSEEPSTEPYNFLDSESVLPYRAGLEEADRRKIEDRLSSGSLRGVISTSALELGIDIKGLDVAVLIGVPRSSTSLHQRIGRIGRNRPGSVLVLNSGDVYDEAVFRNPSELLKRPPAEGALYLENPRIQYVHALCLARSGGEHDQLSAHADEGHFASPVSWPAGFLDVCQQERTGQLSNEFQTMKAESGENPNYTFPLRDVEGQFKVELRLPPVIQPCGQVSHAQLMREAYPGAVYYHALQTYRVTSVSRATKTVTVRRERRYTTTPSKLPTKVYPNLTPGHVYRALDYDDVRLVECDVQVRDTVVGFKERRGRNETTVPYPLTSIPGIHFNDARFQRFYFTTGVLIAHPVLMEAGVDCEILAGLYFEALLMTAPFERQDLGSSSDKIARVSSNLLAEQTKYMAVFDQTYGSLRLSGRLLEPGVFPAVADRAYELAVNEEANPLSPATISAAARLRVASQTSPVHVSITGTAIIAGEGDKARVIMPGSKGLNTGNGNAEFHVDRVFVHPRLGGLAYSGRHVGARNVLGQSESIPVDKVVPILGESKEGFYDFETGELSEEVQD